MKQKYINWSKTGEAKAKYGADAVVIDQETKYGIQTKLLMDEGGELKYEHIYNGGDIVDNEVEPSKIDEYDEFENYPDSDLGDQVEQDKEMSASESLLNAIGVFRDSKENKYLELSFGKIVNGKGSFLKGLAKTTGLKFAYEIEKAMNKTKIPLGRVAILSGLRPASFNRCIWERGEL